MMGYLLYPESMPTSTPGPGTAPVSVLLIVDRLGGDTELLQSVLRRRMGHCELVTVNHAEEAAVLVKSTPRMIEGKKLCAVVSEVDGMTPAEELRRLQRACEAQGVPFVCFVDRDHPGAKAVVAALGETDCFDASIQGFKRLTEHVCRLCRGCGSGEQ